MRMLPAEVKRHRFDVEEYHRMLEAGVLSEDDRVELIGGEIVDMTPIGRPHLSCVVALTHLLVMAAGGRYYVSVQNPIRLGPSDEPQPDISLIGTRPEPDAEGPPGSDEVLLVIEVADTSLAYDSDVKLPLYARAGIPEAWIVDLRGRKVEVYADPTSGGYRIFRVARPSEQLGSEAVEGLSLSVDEVLR
jgi:Uma2 family endonuclease